MMPKGVAVFCVILILSFQMLHVTAFKQEYSSKAQYGDANLPDGPSSAIDTGMQVVLAACDLAKSYKLYYLVNGFLVLKAFSNADDDVCKGCDKKKSANKALDKSFTDKVLSYLPNGLTITGAISLLTNLGPYACEMAEDYRKK